MIDWQDIEQFWARTKQPEGPSGCWIWTGGVVVQFANEYYFPQRLAYMLTHGPIPHGLEIRTRCANNTGICVNPTHLLIGETWKIELDHAVRQRRGKRPQELFTYEDDINCARDILQEHINRSTNLAEHAEMSTRIALIQQERQKAPVNKQQLLDEHRRLYLVWALTAEGTRKAQELEARMMEIKELLGDTSSGVQLRNS